MKKLFALVMGLVIGLSLFGCNGSKAPHTAKYLKTWNSAVGNQYAEICDKYGVEYVDENGISMVAGALANDKDLAFLEAVIKDKPNLYRTYKTQQGADAYPLRHILYTADPYFISDMDYEKVRTLLNAGTELMFFGDTNIPLFEAWKLGNTKLAAMLLEAHKKQKKLDFTGADFNTMVNYIAMPAAR